jgi:hypothetical protein
MITFLAHYTYSNHNLIKYSTKMTGFTYIIYIYPVIPELNLDHLNELKFSWYTLILSKNVTLTLSKRLFFSNSMFQFFPTSVVINSKKLQLDLLHYNGRPVIDPFHFVIKRFTGSGKNTVGHASKLLNIINNSNKINTGTPTNIDLNKQVSNETPTNLPKKVVEIPFTNISSATKTETNSSGSTYIGKILSTANESITYTAKNSIPSHNMLMDKTTTFSTNTNQSHQRLLDEAEQRKLITYEDTSEFPKNGNAKLTSHGIEIYNQVIKNPIQCVEDMKNNLTNVSYEAGLLKLEDNTVIPRSVQMHFIVIYDYTNGTYKAIGTLTSNQNSANPNYGKLSDTQPISGNNKQQWFQL